MAPSPASKKIRDFLISAIGLSEGIEIHAARSSRHSEVGYTSCGDIVLWKGGGGIGAGHVWFHAEVAGEPITLIQQLVVHSHDRKAGTAELHSTESFDILETSAIIDSVIWHERAPGVIRAIVPRDL